MIRRIVILVLVLIVLASIGLVIAQRAGEDDEDGPIEASGSIEATHIDLAAEIGGRVEEVLVEEGEQVEPGQLLVRLDSSLLEAQREQAEATLELADRALRAAAAQPGPAARLATAQRAQAQASLALVEAQLERAELRAPVTATVLTRAIEPGEVTMPGATLLRLGLLDALRITVYVPEDRYGEIEIGDGAELEVDSFEDREFDAVVRRIAEEAEFTPRNVQTASGRKSTVYAIELDIEDEDGRLKPGMPADLRFDD